MVSQNIVLIQYTELKGVETPIPVAERSKASGIAGSNPAGGIDICVVCCTVKTKAQARTMTAQKKYREREREQKKDFR